MNDGNFHNSKCEQMKTNFNAEKIMQQGSASLNNVFGTGNITGSAIPLVKSLDDAQEPVTGTLGNQLQQPVNQYGMPINVEPNTSMCDDISVNIEVVNKTPNTDTTTENNMTLGTLNEVVQHTIAYPNQGYVKPQYIHERNRKNEIYKSYIIITSNNQLQYCRIDKNGQIIDGNILCQNPFNSVYRLVDYTKNKTLKYIVVSYNNSYTEPSIIKQEDLYKPNLLDILKSGLMMNIGDERVPKTKLSSAMAEFLQSEANKNVEYTLYPKAGWIPDKKIFYTLYIENMNELFLKLQKMHLGLPVFKRTLKHNNLVFKAPNFQDSRQSIYQLAFYGSMLMTLLQNNNADTGFVIWMPNNSKSRKFADVFFRVWESYQAKIDISQRVQMKEIVNEAKDEPVIIQFDDNRQNSKRNLKNLLDGVLCGTECAGVGKLAGVPIIISDNFFQLREFIEEPERILPLIPDMEEEYTMKDISTGTAAKFIDWFTKSYDLLQTVLHHLIIGSKHETFSRLEKSFLSILVIFNIFLYKSDNIIKYYSVVESYERKILSELKKLQEYLKNFLDKTKAEMFGQWLSQCLISGELILKNNDEVEESELNGKVAVYSDSGEVYFDETAFKIVLKKGEMTDYNFMLGALAEQDAIQTEAKINGSITYKIKCAVPSDCGINQRRMIKFKAGVLMDKEGAEFDGELLQEKKSDEFIKKHCTIEVGTRHNGKKLLYAPYDKDNTNAMVLVTGSSGNGKTNFSYNMIRQALEQDVIVLVPDYSGSFEVGKFYEFDKTNIFSAEDFPVSPFNKMTPDEDKETTARRCAELLRQVFDMGVNQEKLLKGISMEFLESGIPVTLSGIANAINYMEEPEFESIRRLNIYGTLNVFEKSEKSWDDIYKNGTGLYVIKFDERYTSQDQIKCTELLLMSLFEWLRTQGQEKCNKKIQIHLDEAQSLRYSEKSPLTLLMRQGRKFGCSVFLYTQSLFTFDTNVKEIWTQAALLVNFKQTQKGAGQLAKLLEDDEKEAKELARQLKHLKKGQAIASGCFQKGNGMQTNIINVKVQTPLAE